MGANRGFKEIGFTLQVELLFADVGCSLDIDTLRVLDFENEVEFNVVSTSVYTLPSPTKGLHEYLPVVFDEGHFCVANLIVQGTILDFRFRPDKLATEISSYECDIAINNGLARCLFNK